MKLKNYLAIALATVMVVTVVPTEVVCAKNVKKYGFTYDDSMYTPKFSKAVELVTETSFGAEVGCTTFRFGRLRNKKKVSKNITEDVIVVKMLMEPKKNTKRDIYGVSEYLKCKITLPSNDVNEWAPSNIPPKDNWTFGIGVGGSKDGVSGQITASTTIVKERLEVEADVRQSEKTATFIYDYKPYKSKLSWSTTKNKYFRNASQQFCMISVNTKEWKSIKFNYNANYTLASSKEAKPADVAPYSSWGKGSFTWKP